MSAYDPKRTLGEPSKPTLKSVHSDIRGTSTMMVCDMGASLYEPINIYKPVAPNIGIVDGPFEYLTAGGVRLPLPFTTRMTVVRLSNGDLFLHSPIKFEGRLANELLGLGAVRHLVSPNQFHYAHIGEWARAFPNAILWASPRVRERARARNVDVDFTRDLEASPPEEWRREIDQTLFPGGYFKEFIFFHEASKTLILADTIINIELDKVTEPWRTAAKFAGMYHPYGQIFFGMRLPLFPPAEEGGGGNQKNPRVAAAAYFAQPWPMFRCRCRQSNP
jgi:Domain of unknown function (DUF4336)